MRTLEQVLDAHPFPLFDGHGNPSQLKPMQVEDINALAKLGRALGDLPVGYGKTPIATAVSLMLEPPATLIIVPPILVPRWGKWLRSIPGITKVLEYEGSVAERKAMQLSGQQFIIASYGIFRNDFPRIRKELGESMLIVDEAQNCKNHNSVLFKRVKEFSDGYPLLLMSGTIMSKPGDGYAYCKLNSPNAYRTYAMFENIHVAKYNFFDQPIEWTNLELLQENLDLARVKRTKEEVHAHLPQANFLTLEYSLGKPHMKLYNQLMQEQLMTVADGIKLDATTAQRMYNYSQQIVANYGWFADDESLVANLFYLLDSVIDEIGLGQSVMPGERPRSKLVIWTVYKMTSRRILKYMNDLGIKTVAAFSETNSVKAAEAFENDPETVCIVAQPGSLGVGCNLQYVCNECFYAEFPLTSIPFWQSAGRIDREGQIFNPNIRLAVAKGTIQEQLLSNLYSNDELVRKASGNKRSIKDFIFPS